MTHTPIPAAIPDSSPPADAARPVVRFRDRVRQRAGEQDLILVAIGEERFGLPLESVEELVEAPHLRHVPGAPETLLGVFTYGETLLPLYSPSALLGAAAAGTQVALVMRAGRRRIALAVDDADDVMRLALSDVREPPRSAHQDDVVLGVFWREGTLVTLVDARAIVAAYGALIPEAA